MVEAHRAGREAVADQGGAVAVERADPVLRNLVDEVEALGHAGQVLADEVVVVGEGEDLHGRAVEDRQADALPLEAVQQLVEDVQHLDVDLGHGAGDVEAQHDVAARVDGLHGLRRHRPRGNHPRHDRGCRAEREDAGQRECPSRQGTAERGQCAQAFGAGDAGGVSGPGTPLPSESEDEPDRERHQHDGDRAHQHPDVR